MCDARQVCDQMSCARCGYVWDVNDPEPPACKTDAQQHSSARDEQLALARRILQA